MKSQYILILETEGAGLILGYFKWRALKISSWGHFWGGTYDFSMSGGIQNFWKKLGLKRLKTVFFLPKFTFFEAKFP